VSWNAYPEYAEGSGTRFARLPAHWKVKRLKYLASINDEALGEGTHPGFELAYVDIGSVDAVAGITGVQQLVFEDAPSRARRIARDGDTIVSTVRTYLRAIAPIVAPPPNLVVSTGFAVIRPRALRADYLSYALRETGFVEIVVARSVGVSYPAVNASELGDIELPLPPEPEQRAIAAFLDAKLARIDAVSAVLGARVGVLLEYRAALITAAVTGQIDVRSAAP